MTATRTPTNARAQPEPTLRARRGRHRVFSMLLGCLVVVLATAGTVATGSLLEVKTFVDALKQSPKLQLGNELATANAGGPQTILLIGSDKRTGRTVDAQGPPHSDTMLLVRLDPSEPETTMLSIPRDLKVTIRPDHGTPSLQKINAAYSIGGARLAVKTVKQVLHIPINHVIDINFRGFREVVDYLGCVYVQVDRRYFNDNNPPTGGGTPYATINVQPGYQRLCGSDALDYVRFRHLDTDLVRNARQQDFLRQIKNQVGADGLIAKRVGLERIFGRYAGTDIRSTDDVLRMLELLVQSASHPVHQVVFDATLGPSYVTATPVQIRKIVDEFMHGGAVKGGITVPVAGKAHRHVLPPTRLSPASASEIANARAIAHRIPFRMYYPVRRVEAPANLADAVRAYRLHGTYAYVVVVNQGGLGQYYDVQGTLWTNPPILANPNQTIRIGTRTFQLYFEGKKLKLVAWRDGPAVYWVSNTLQDMLTNRQMLAVAAATKPL